MCPSHQKCELAPSAVREAPTLHPTPAEFANPSRYLASLEPLAARFGVLKVVPPPGWRPPPPAIHPSAMFETKRQAIHKLQVRAWRAILSDARWELKRTKHVAGVVPALSVLSTSRHWPLPARKLVCLHQYMCTCCTR